MEGSRYLRAAAASWLVLLFCLIGVGAFPFPDFGIPGPVSSSGRVLSTALGLGDDFDAVNDDTVELTSTYARLATVRDALYSISNAVASAGQAIATAFDTLVTSTGPSIDGVFTPATDAIGSLEALLAGPDSFSDAFTTLESNIGTYVTSEFRDSFAELAEPLKNLRLALDRLKPAIQQAKAAAKGSGTLTASHVSRYVTPKMVQDVLAGLLSTRAGIQVITYTVSSTLSKLELADEFIVEITAEAATATDDVPAAFDIFSEATTLATDDNVGALVSSLKAGYARETIAISAIQSDLTASADYANFEPLLSTIDGLLGAAALSTLEEDLTGHVTTYLELVGSVDDDVMGLFSDEGCSPVFALVQTLISNGPYAMFCFEKYAAQTFNLFPLFVALIADCYDAESINLEALYVAVVPLVRLILFDVEDLAEVLTTCLSFSDDSMCFSMISPLYETLLELTEAKRDYLLELYRAETSASVQRFSACYHSHQYSLRQLMKLLEDNVELCELDGPMPI